LNQGDVFAVLPYDLHLGGVYGPKVQLIEADRACNLDNKADVECEFKAGIKQDDSGQPQQYAFSKFHPGE
jgi:capsid protein